MYMRDAAVSSKATSFLSRLFIRVGKNFYGMRQPNRVLVTGTVSEKVPKVLSAATYAYVILSQLKSWGANIPWVKEIVKRRWPETKNANMKQSRNIVIQQSLLGYNQTLTETT